jgi:hypothetical protein
MKNQTKNPVSAQAIPRFTSDLLLILILLFRVLQKKPEMDFLGVAVDGSSKEDEEDDHLTLQSTGSNDRRSSGSVRSIGSNPNEKPMSPEEVAYTDKRIKELLEIMQSSWEARQKFLCRKQKKMERKIEKVQQMARECGASECTNLWPTVMDIACNERATKFFMASDPAGRLKIIKHYAGVKDLGGSQPCDIQRKPLLKVCMFLAILSMRSFIFNDPSFFRPNQCCPN